MATEEVSVCTLAAPFGCVELTAAGDTVSHVRCRNVADPRTKNPVENSVLRRACAELEEYFRGVRREFQVPTRVPPETTTFQQRVWSAMLRIPYGETQTYGDLARELKTGARAVGGACRRNPLPIFVPCHRVVAKHGAGGYAGDWQTGLALDVKLWLLHHEAAR